MIFTIGGIKGGTGKTTVATNFVIWLAVRGFDVLLVDADEQESSTGFTTWREQNHNGSHATYTAVKITGSGIVSQLSKLKPKYDHIVIDVGGRDTDSQRAALVASDTLLLPLRPRMWDFWTVDKVNGLLRGAESVKGLKMPFFAFLNQADHQGAYNTEMAEAVKQIEGVNFLDQSLGNRIAFASAAFQGLGVIELKPQDKKATAEVNTLFSSILEKSKQ